MLFSSGLWLTFPSDGFTGQRSPGSPRGGPLWPVREQKRKLKQAGRGEELQEEEEAEHFKKNNSHLRRTTSVIFFIHMWRWNLICVLGSSHPRSFFLCDGCRQRIAFMAAAACGPAAAGRLRKLLLLLWVQSCMKRRKPVSFDLHFNPPNFQSDW